MISDTMQLNDNYMDFFHWLCTYIFFGKNILKVQILEKNIIKKKV